MKVPVLEGGWHLRRSDMSAGLHFHPSALGDQGEISADHATKGSLTNLVNPDKGVVLVLLALRLIGFDGGDDDFPSENSSDGIP